MRILFDSTDRLGLNLSISAILRKDRIVDLTDFTVSVFELGVNKASEGTVSVNNTSAEINILYYIDNVHTFNARSIFCAH